MPALPDSIKISGMGNFPKRAPYSRHEFVGGNVYMLTLLRNNIDSLGVTANCHALRFHDCAGGPQPERPVAQARGLSLLSQRTPWRSARQSRT